MRCSAAHDEVCHAQREDEQRTNLVQCEVEDIIHFMESEADRCHEGVIASRREADSVH